MSTLDNERATFLVQYRELAKRLFERELFKRKIAADKGITVEQAFQLMPGEYFMKRIAFDFKVSESTVYNVNRIVQSIPYEGLTSLIA